MQDTHSGGQVERYMRSRLLFIFSHAMLASIEFAVDQPTPTSRPYHFVTVRKTQKPLERCPKAVQVEDLRCRQTAPRIEDEGFALARVPYTDLDGHKGWEERYMQACSEVSR